ncbi:hypothetical protein YpF1991016_2261 [Yersinia pestis biovar Orientalis str. F1991016]|nr:hypothetical protein YpF1991016_2261 [Yersinia pestis biovar Orientalis str. F1991016]
MTGDPIAYKLGSKWHVMHSHSAESRLLCGYLLVLPCF